MTQRDYVKFAEMFGEAWADYPNSWKTIYEAIYTPFVKILESDNPRFDVTKFGFAVATRAGELQAANRESIGA